MDLRSRKTQGLISGLGCNIWWGIMPIYWQLLIPIESSTIIFYRIVLVAVVCLIAALIAYDKETIIEPFKDKKVVGKMILAGIFITANWSIYIWAVNAGHVIQTCIGYYIEPLVVCAFGLVVFKEKLDKWKTIALGFATVGVIAGIIYFGQVPIIGLSVAGTFAIYAAMKKGLNMPPILSLLYETIFIMPFALIVIIYLEATGNGAWGVGEPYQYFLMLLCGLFTALPLTLFADATNKLTLFAVGLLEYISPTISLAVGIFILGEAFEPIQLVAFGIIWIGLIFFSYGEYKGKDLPEN